MDWWWSKGGGDVARLGIVSRVETVGVALDSYLGSSSLIGQRVGFFALLRFFPLRVSSVYACVRADQRHPRVWTTSCHEINRETVRFGRFVGWGGGG